MMTTPNVEWHPWGAVPGDLDSEVWWAPDYGVIIQRGPKFWASNDTRWTMVGVAPNDELVQPTIGPFASKDEAAVVYHDARKVAARFSSEIMLDLAEEEESKARRNHSLAIQCVADGSSNGASIGFVVAGYHAGIGKRFRDMADQVRGR